MVNPLVNPSYLLPPLVVSAASLVLLVLVLGRAAKSTTRTVFCLLLSCVALAGFLIYGMRGSANIHQALNWDRASFVITYAIFVLFYHFTLSYTNRKVNRSILYFAYATLIVACVFGPSTLIVERMIIQPYGYAPIAGPLSFVLAVIIAFLAIRGIINLVHTYRASFSAEKRNHLAYLITATAILIAGALLDGFSPLPPIAIWAALTFCIICTISILKDHLLDIHIVIRRGLAYLLLSVVVATPYVITLFILHRVLDTRIDQWWHYLLIILPMAIVLRPLYSWAQNWIDRVFYRDRYDYLRSLEQFINRVHYITAPKELGDNIIRLVRGAMRTRNACLLLKSVQSGGMSVVSATGLENPPRGAVIRDNSTLIRWFQNHKDIVHRNKFDIFPELQNISRTEKRNLARLIPELYVPIHTQRGELIGLLILGAKLSQQYYFLEDRTLLSTVSRQLAVILENARLYHDAVSARENLEAWLNGIDDIIIISDNNNRIEFSNRAAERNLGLRSGDLYPSGLAEGEPLSPTSNHAGMSSEPSVSRYNINFSDRELDAVIAPLSNADGSLSMISVFRDITESKKAEEEKRELERKARVTDRLASVGEMASGVAHEINNPLTGVVGFSELLMQRELPEDIREEVRIIHDGSKRVADIVKRLLSFARQQKPVRTRTDINEIVENTLALRKYSLETGNIEVITSLDPDLPWTVADIGQLQQVFMNIIVNAEAEMKKAHGRGKLTVKTEQADDLIRISFRDDGPGIAKENLGKVFDPFFTTKPVGEGTGLGLSLSHGIIKEHKGNLYVESIKGKGTTFFVEIPLIAEAEQLEMNEPEETPDNKKTGGRILVIDDEPNVLSFLKEVLTREGYEVETADNGEEALEMMRNTRYSAIICDIKLPQMSGTEIYREMGKIAPSLKKRVIFVTGDVIGAGTAAFLKKNNALYVAKPIDITIMKKSLNAVTGAGKQ